MSYVSPNEIESITSEIQSLVGSCHQYLEQVEDATNKININYHLLNSYNGQKVLNGERIEETKETIKYFYQKYHITGIGNVGSLVSTIKNEISDFNKSFMIIEVILRTMQDAAVMIAIYVKNVEDFFDPNGDMPVLNKMQYAKRLMNDDAANGYQVLYRTPVIRTGKIDLELRGETKEYVGEYLQYYNENGIKVYAPCTKIQINNMGEYIYGDMTEEEKNQFINQTSKYYKDIKSKMDTLGSNFQETATGNLKNMYLLSIDYDKEVYDKSNWSAYTYLDEAFVADITNFEDEDYYQFMVEDVIPHELGHAYDYHSGNIVERNILLKYNISESKEWENIFQQISEQDAIEQEYLRAYAYTSPQECFAECVTEYYNTPNDLKNLKLNIDGYNNLYQYMDQYLR